MNESISRLMPLLEYRRNLKFLLQDYRKFSLFSMSNLLKICKCLTFANVQHYNHTQTPCCISVKDWYISLVEVLSEFLIPSKNVSLGLSEVYIPPETFGSLPVILTSDNLNHTFDQANNRITLTQRFVAIKFSYSYRIVVAFCIFFFFTRYDLYTTT